MQRRRISVRELAAEARLDDDEALLTLWEAGFDHLRGPEDPIFTINQNTARRVLGLATRRDLRDRGYWRALFVIDDEQLDELLEQLGCPRKPGGRSLPKKALPRLRAEARRRNIDPMTGIRVAPPVTAVRPAREQRVSEWVCPGHTRELRWLDDQEVIGIHMSIAADFADTPDPIKPAGVRSHDLLASAVFRPRTSLGDTLKYATVEGSAAALLCAIIHDHPFINGNKRTALVAMLVFLDENGFIPTCDEDEFFKLVLQVAQHRIFDREYGNSADGEVLGVARLLYNNIRPVEIGDHPIPFRRLRSILTTFGCDIERPAGARVRVRRPVKRRFLGITRTSVLQAHVPYVAEGREFGKGVLKNIRAALELDEAHGIDSRDFYGADGTLVTDFIATYRKTLRRLARF
jgi:death-on-curing family protein